MTEHLAPEQEMAEECGNDNRLIMDSLYQISYELEMAVSTVYLLKDGILHADATARDSSRAMELLAGILDRTADDMKRIIDLITEEEGK